MHKTTPEYEIVSTLDKKGNPGTVSVFVCDADYSYRVWKGEEENEIILNRIGKMADDRIIHYLFDTDEGTDWQEHIGDAVIHAMDLPRPERPIRMVCC